MTSVTYETGHGFGATMNRVATLAELNERWTYSGDRFERFGVIREAYDIVTPLIHSYGRIDPYFLDWSQYFTPIESLAWCDIRELGLPLYPQVPVLGYFVDFGDPIKRIAVELDGRAYHSAAKDTPRDERLWTHGWRTFRIPGSQAMSSGTDIVEVLRDCTTESAAFNELMEWGTSWGEGLFWALGHRYYGKAGFSCLPSDIVWRAASNILYDHQRVGFPLDDE